MQFEDGVAQTLFQKNLISVMSENGVSKVNFKADNVHVNWNVVKLIYGDGNPSLPMVGCERIFFSLVTKFG
jgi:hypothetical protein